MGIVIPFKILSVLVVGGFLWAFAQKWHPQYSDNIALKYISHTRCDIQNSHIEFTIVWHCYIIYGNNAYIQDNNRKQFYISTMDLSLIGW